MNNVYKIYNRNNLACVVGVVILLMKYDSNIVDEIIC